jgi:hypothetical protein
MLGYSIGLQPNSSQNVKTRIEAHMHYIAILYGSVGSAEARLARE